MPETKWRTGRNVLLLATLLSWAALAAGYFTSPDRFFESYLTAFCFAAFTLLGCMFFVFVQYLSGAAWSASVKRFMENIMVSVPAGFLLFIPIAVGITHLYVWANPQVALTDPAVHVKVGYLNERAFMIRAAVYIGLWTIWAFAVWSQSAKQDTTKSIEQTKAASRWSAPGLLIVMFSGSLASFDWIMSLDPHWYSTIFGLYCIAGGAGCFFAIVTLVAQGFQSSGELKNSITTEHYHDLGKWMFAMAVFWAYMAVAQYLLIWYANIPEETSFFRHRLVGGWTGISVFLPIGRFCVPFALLIGRAPKRNPNILRLSALWIILMEYLDMYWMIMPNFYPQGPSLSWLDAAAMGGVISVFGLVFWSRFQRHPMVTLGDLRFEQGLHFHQV
ncbi:MAG TPA: hypothetical protein VGL82_19690 [Bryobacteraceae bacterium]